MGRPTTRDHLADARLDLPRQRAAVGVAQDDDLGAAAHRGVERLAARTPRPRARRRRSARRRRRRDVRRSRGRRRSPRSSRRFSSVVVRRTSLTCTIELLPNSVQTGASDSSRARRLGSSSAARCPRAASTRTPRCAADVHARSRARRKNSTSFGFEPGHPPSMNATPSASSCSRDAELVRAREGDPLALRAVAQRRVVDRDGRRARAVRSVVAHGLRSDPRTRGCIRARRRR